MAVIETASARGVARAVLPDDPSSPTDRHTVLVVDDEPAVLQAIRRACVDESFDVVLAGNGSEALAIMAGRPVALIISDFRMPGMNGAELLRRVKDRHVQTIRILLTGAADMDVVNKAIEDGIIYKFVTKPWNDNDLKMTIRLGLSQFDLLRENRRLKQISSDQKKELERLHRFSSDSTGSLGSLLINQAGLLPAQVDMLERYCSGSDVSMIRAVLDMGMIEERDLLRLVQDESKVDVITLDERAIDRSLGDLLPREICEASCVVPVRGAGGQSVLAVANPLDLPSIDYIKFQAETEFTVRLAAASEIEFAIACLFGDDPGPEVREKIEFSDFQDDINLYLNDGEFKTTEQLLAGSSAPSAVQMVNAIIAEAITAGASDIHIEPHPDQTLVRFRVDGLLQQRMQIPVRQHLTTVSRIKILARIDISVRRLPQDGRISVRFGDRLIDVRVSTLPTIYGEKVVCRLLDKSVSVRSIDELGIRGTSLSRLRNLINVPQGVIIATGPTGSGKTTTLYSLLQERINKTQNFVTIEDPVEYFVEDAAQVHIHQKAGLTFASTLRATLRQDPDVILVGEIRDAETAKAAFQAAMTGHLVFTSLHTNSTVGTITRLLHLGIEPFLVGSVVQGVIAQRLVRAVCPHCRIDQPYDREALDLLGLDPDSVPPKLARGAGCERCDGTGYRGRIGLYEVFQMNAEFRRLITTSYDETRVVRMAYGLGMESLMQDGLAKVLAGDTTLDEILRVLGPSLKNEHKCTTCHASLEPKFTACPYCGTIHRRRCKACDELLDADWTACPFCGAPAPKKRAGAGRRPARRRRTKET